MEEKAEACVRNATSSGRREYVSCYAAIVPIHVDFPF
jgi:hypothetical protein